MGQGPILSINEDAVQYVHLLIIHFFSFLFPLPFSFFFDFLFTTVRQAGDWGNYARGAAAALAPLLPATPTGLVGFVSADLESEVGLSSSAAVGVCYLRALLQVNGLEVSALDVVRLDQVRCLCMFIIIIIIIILLGRYFFPLLTSLPTP